MEPDTKPIKLRRVLVAYATLSGSTAGVAEAVAEAMGGSGWEVETRPLDRVEDLEGYNAAVVGAPMILGWHRAARRFLRRNRKTLGEMPLALFITAMSLTETGVREVEGVPLYVDPELPKAPRDPARLSLRERYARPSSYLRSILRAAQPARPLSVALFGGQLVYGQLPWWAVPLALLLVRDRAGDRRDWESIRKWATDLPTSFEASLP